MKTKDTPQLPEEIGGLTDREKTALLTMGRALRRGEVLDGAGYINTHALHPVAAKTLHTMRITSNYALLDVLEQHGIQEVF